LALSASPALLKKYQIFCVPGGFSYGDDLAAGRILARQLTRRLGDSLRDFRDRDGLILGICNGFQVLLQTTVLLDHSQGADTEATLTLNRSGKYEARWVWLTIGESNSVFLRGISGMYLPVAHAEGRFTTRNDQVLQSLVSRKQVALRYALPGASPSPIAKMQFPANPNGSMDDIAALADTTGRALGLMPHPERYITRTQHPRWTREQLSEWGDGMRIFRNAISYFG
jgi:phosphoribosylformylglycinamidine synthase